MELGAGRAAGRGRASAAAGRRAERDATLEEGATAALEPSRVALHQHDDLFGVLRPGRRCSLIQRVLIDLMTLDICGMATGTLADRVAERAEII